MSDKITVIGAGLAGCEAAWQLAQRGIPVSLMEMKPSKMTPAHTDPGFGELVCSNSLRSDQPENAAGLLKEEMRMLGGLIVSSADRVRTPAGGALAVDRGRFSALITERIKNHPLIEIKEGEVSLIPDGRVIIASGPLTTEPLAEAIGGLFSERKFLNFFDAAAPIVSRESIDMDRAFLGSRYGKGTPDYINCPMNKDEYEAFHEALISARTARVRGFEAGNVFEGCMPVEVMAGRGADTLRFGPLKPVGLPDPETGRESWAVCQLRSDNREGTMYNIVGFQTHLTFPEQKRVFSMIPALKNAEFLRYGVMHRNTYLDSPGLLDRYYCLKGNERISFAGQITGVEGYVESAASGFLAGVEAARKALGQEAFDFPRITAIGALALYVSDPSVTNFQPMNINFGIIEPLGFRVKGKKNKNAAIAARSLDYLTASKREGRI